MTEEERKMLLGCLLAPFVLLWFGARELNRTLEAQRKEREEYLWRTARLQTFLVHSRTGKIFSASETERLAYLFLLAANDVSTGKYNVEPVLVTHRLREIIEWPRGASEQSVLWLVENLRAFKKVGTQTGWKLVLDAKRGEKDCVAGIYPPLPSLPNDAAKAGEAVKLLIRQLPPTFRRRLPVISLR